MSFLVAAINMNLAEIKVDVWILQTYSPGVVQDKTYRYAARVDL